jgi:5-bromo-4-chloroindolyl phosphate hydrolysis protein
MIVFGYAETVVVVLVLGMIVVPIRTTQIISIVVVPGAAAKHFADLSPACRQAGRQAG